MSTVYDAVVFGAHFRNESLLNDGQKYRAWKPYRKAQNSYYGLGFEVLWKNDTTLVRVGHAGS